LGSLSGLDTTLLRASVDLNCGEEGTEQDVPRCSSFITPVVCL
jgi:hypothetical protein